MPKFFERREETSGNAPNDCDLEARQQLSIEQVGYTNVDTSGDRITATDPDGNHKIVPTKVFYDDRTVAGGDQ